MGVDDIHSKNPEDGGIEMPSRKSADSDYADANEGQLPPPVTLTTSSPASSKLNLPAPVYVCVWITLSSSVILYNKYILSTANFPFPVFLITWHLFCATIFTRVLAKTTNLLDGLKTVQMTGRIYLRAVLPIGFFFSLSLICGNQPYLTLTVAFIQMLKATTPVAVLLATWAMRLEKPSLKTFGNVSIIVVGIIIASYGEVRFVLVGVLFQIAGIVFEATRLALVQSLLSSPEYKMDPMVSLYYFAPICATFNFVVFLFTEFKTMTLQNVIDLGPVHLVTSAIVAFGLNVSVVLLIGKTSSLVLTLCGVLKDILLVAISVFFDKPITLTSTFGYSIAICGLIYYKIGPEKLGEHYMRLKSDGSHKWQEYGHSHPKTRKAFVAILGVIFFLIILGSLTGGSGLTSAIDASGLKSD